MRSGGRGSWYVVLAVLHYGLQKAASGSPFSRSKLRPWLRSVAGCITNCSIGEFQTVPHRCRLPGRPGSGCAGHGFRMRQVRRHRRLAGTGGHCWIMCAAWAPDLGDGLDGFHKTRMTVWFTACGLFATAKDGYLCAQLAAVAGDRLLLRRRGRCWPGSWLVLGPPGPQAAERHGGGG